MAISSDISDLSWLHQPNPGEFGLKSMQVGLEAGRSFMSAYNSSQENSRQNAMMPLRKQMMDYQVKGAALDIEAGLRKQQDDLMSRAGRAELARVANEISASAAWANPQSEAKVWEIAAKYPSLMPTADFKSLLGQFDAAGAAAIKARDAETRAAKAANDLSLGEQRIGVQKERIDYLESKTKDEIASREKIAAENNSTKERIASQRLASEKLGSAMDILPRAMLAKYKATVDAISEEEIPLAAKERKMSEALERLKEGRDAYEAERKPSASGESVIMTDPSGKKFKVPSSNVDKAKQRGWKEYEG